VIYSDGWFVCTSPPIAPWISTAAKPVDVIDGYQWELYHVDEDCSQANNLAAKHPDKLKNLQPDISVR
jgi:arylsulfatase